MGVKNKFGFFFNSKKTIVLWIAIHFFLVALPLYFSPIKINTSLFSVLPAADELQQVQEAEQIFSSKTSQGFYILIGHAELDSALFFAESLYNALQTDSLQASFNLYIDSSATRDLEKFFYTYRYVLQDEYTRNLLLNENINEIQERALQSVYGSFSIVSLEHLSEDPFLLGGNYLKSYINSPWLSGNSFAPQKGVLVATYQNEHYIMLRGMLSKNTSGIAVEDHFLERLFSIYDQKKQNNPEMKIVFSGVPFHSFESSKNAQKEVSLITIISLLLIILLFILIFKSPFPLFIICSYIFVAFLVAFSITLFFFKEVHLLTFVFGTSIIGVCIDYASHFFIDWKGSKENKSSLNVRSNILKSISIGFLTTQAGYAAIMLTPFPLLRQMALFTFVGLASSFLSIVLIFPHFPLPPVNKRKLPLAIADFFISIYRNIFSWKKSIKIAFFFIIIVFVGIGFYQLKLGNDIRSLYTMSESLMQSEITASKLLNMGSSGYFYIVSGSSEEEVHQKEEAFTKRLDSLKNQDTSFSYISSSLIVPSIKKQNETYQAIGKTILPSIKKQLELLNLNPEDSSIIKSYQLASEEHLTVHSDIPSTLDELLQSFWIGKINDRYYSVIIPFHAPSKSVLKEIAQNNPSVFFVDKMHSVGEALTKLSHIALGLIALIYVLVFLLLSYIYNLKASFKIIMTPVSACILSTATLGILNVPFNFFAIVGLILTLSIGIDYALFFKERYKTIRNTMLAVLLCFTTTVLSFGFLSLSSFAPVSTFGLSVFFGILYSFLLSPLNGQLGKSHE